MTEEKLEKEAESYSRDLRERIIADDDFERLEQFDANVVEAYIAGAAPREKWIADLEKRNTEAKKMIKELVTCIRQISEPGVRLTNVDIFLEPAENFIRG